MDPTTRSRTGLFLSYRDSRASSTRFSRSRITFDDSYDEQQQLINHDTVDIDLPPKWVDISEQVQLILADTQAKITAVEKLHAKHVLPGFTDRSHEEQEIDAATTDITKNFRQCQSLIQRIGAISVPHTFPPSQTEAQALEYEVQAAKNVQRGLAAKVQELSATFRKKQRVYMEKLQGHAIKNQDLLIASGTISLKGSEGLSAVDDDVEAATHTRSQSLSLTQVNPSVDLQTRDRELTEIANSIASLAELFKDLSVLVIDQGTILDSVEYNIEQTAAHVSEAVQELNTATRYQKSTGRRKCIFLLLLIIFGLIIVIIFKPKRHLLSPPTPSEPIPSLPGVDFLSEKSAERSLPDSRFLRLSRIHRWTNT
ncbi:t-SNARE [Guyanagaster necrorhizus]|uniref:t-SNARE n=1 Tax=Guyanagaster necrorhizus TaxID=856835 RepID=A0A9P7VZQ3_9AGAR|nr:t-SNARE [Guyanagaster necrorhizus MCA 3950]KAG7449517.1 t-SNARE [Guyanagaster necrorhizus MCA 3950]